MIFAIEPKITIEPVSDSIKFINISCLCVDFRILRENVPEKATRYTKHTSRGRRENTSNPFCNWLSPAMTTVRTNERRRSDTAISYIITRARLGRCVANWKLRRSAETRLFPLRWQMEKNERS